MTSEVKEGFLCPICMCDLGDEIQLQVHFEQKHSKEDPIFLQNIKDLFGKAKKKILNNEDMDQDFTNFASSVLQKSLNGDQNQKFLNAHPVSGSRLDQKFEELPSLKILNHSEVFRTERKKKNERNKTVNQLLTRLERLITNCPNDLSKRRVHEQTVVPWIDGENVKDCPTCAKSFNIARRQHHCRLCGAVICDDCSTKISFEFARRIVSPSSPESDDDNQGNHNTDITTSNLKSKLKSKLLGSHESLNSFISTKMNLKLSEEMEPFRTCECCKEFLEQHESRISKSDSKNHPLVLLYSQLKHWMQEGRDLGEKFRKMTESLNSGEEQFSLVEAQLLQHKIVKIVERINILSNDIKDIDPGYANCHLQLHIQNQIRRNAMNVVKQSLVGLPRVPTENEFEKLKEMRTQRATLKVEEEKQAAKLARLRYEQEQIKKRANLSNLQQDVSPKKTQGPVKHDSGLVLTTSNMSFQSQSDDPMVQQIHNLQHFIREAKSLGKIEEVAVLEQNLKELQKEYQRNQLELEENYNSFKTMFHKVSPLQEQEGLDDDEEQDAVDMDEYDASGKNPFM